MSFTEVISFIFSSSILFFLRVLHHVGDDTTSYECICNKLFYRTAAPCRAWHERRGESRRQKNTSRYLRIFRIGHPVGTASAGTHTHTHKYSHKHSHSHMHTHKSKTTVHTGSSSTAATQTRGIIQKATTTYRGAVILRRTITTTTNFPVPALTSSTCPSILVTPD